MRAAAHDSGEAGSSHIFGRLALIAAALTLAGCDSNTAREIRVVGSSTVYPFTTAVAETFVNQGGGRKAPVVESIGTGAGLKRFCEGVGWRSSWC